MLLEGGRAMGGRVREIFNVHWKHRISNDAPKHKKN